MRPKTIGSTIKSNGRQDYIYHGPFLCKATHIIKWTSILIQYNFCLYDLKGLEKLSLAYNPWYENSLSMCAQPVKSMNEELWFYDKARNKWVCLSTKVQDDTHIINGTCLPDLPWHIPISSMAALLLPTTHSCKCPCPHTTCWIYTDLHKHIAWGHR